MGMKFWLSDELDRSLGTTLYSPEVKSDCGRFMDAHGNHPHKYFMSKSDFFGIQEAEGDLNDWLHPFYF